MRVRRAFRCTRALILHTRNAGLSPDNSRRRDILPRHNVIISSVIVLENEFARVTTRLLFQRSRIIIAIIYFRGTNTEKKCKKKKKNKDDKSRERLSLGRVIKK